MSEIKNAVISEVFIGLDDHKKLTSWVILNFGGAKQGFGGLDFMSDNNAATFLAAVLNVVGVLEVKDLVGKAVRVEHDLTKVSALGNFIDNIWYRLYPAATVGSGTTAVEQPVQDAVSTYDPTAAVTVDADGKKHYGLKAEMGVVGADLIG